MNEEKNKNYVSSNKNIALYVDGKKKYEGSMDDAQEVFEEISEDKSVYDLFFRFCNSFGDPLVKEGDSAKDVGEMTWWLVKSDYEDTVYEDDKSMDDILCNFYEDFNTDYHYNDPLVEVMA